MIDFELSAEQRARQDNARQFAARHITPIASTVDRDAAFPWSVIEEGIGVGFTTMLIPTTYGGQGYDNLSAGLVLEELGAACAGIATVFGASVLGMAPIILLGSEEQKQPLLRRIVDDTSGRFLCAFAVTESGAGSAAASGHPQYGVQLRARRDGEAYVLSGSKRFLAGCRFSPSRQVRGSESARWRTRPGNAPVRQRS